MRPQIVSVQRALFKVLSRVCGSFDSEQEHRVRTGAQRAQSCEHTAQRRAYVSVARHARGLTFDSEQEHRVRSLQGASEGEAQKGCQEWLQSGRKRMQAVEINNWRARAREW